MMGKKLMREFNRVALVTGASGGIGKVVAERLAQDGFYVMVHYSGNAAKANEVVDKIHANGGGAVACQADVTEPQQVHKMFKTAQNIMGRLDVVVHCAGVMPLGKIAPESTVMFERVIKTNLYGGFIVLADAQEYVARGGAIIALSSSVLAKNFPNYGPYIASKEGLEGLVRVLANEVRGRDVTVNAISPGPTGTELFFNGKSQEQIETFAKLSPLERIGTPEDIANAVSVLAGPDGRWINSQVVRVNGGFA